MNAILGVMREADANELEVWAAVGLMYDAAPGCNEQGDTAKAEVRFRYRIDVELDADVAGAGYASAGTTARAMPHATGSAMAPTRERFLGGAERAVAVSATLGLPSHSDALHTGWTEKAYVTNIGAGQGISYLTFGGYTQAGAYIVGRADARNWAWESDQGLKLSDLWIDWVDGSAPYLTITPSGIAGDSGWWRSDVEVPIDAMDAETCMESLQARKDGGTWQTISLDPWNPEGSVSFTGDGVHTLDLVATNHKGLERRVDLMPVRIDTVAPVSDLLQTIGEPGEAGWWRSCVTAFFSASDATSGVARILSRIDGTAEQAGTSRQVCGDGVHLLEYWAVDVAGNAEGVKSIEIPIDTTPPSTTATDAGSSGDDGWWVSCVDVSLAATDATSGVASTVSAVNDGAWTPGVFRTLCDDGDWNLRYRSVDLAGNPEADRSRDYRIDRTAPNTNVSLSGTPGNNGWWTSCVVVLLQPRDSTSGLRWTKYTLDGLPTTEGTSALVCSDGAHDFVFHSRDQAGNLEPPRTTALNIDKAPPVTAVTDTGGTAGQNGWWRSCVQTQFSAVDAASGVNETTLVVGGSPPLHGTLLELCEDGAHHVQYRSDDKAGNLESTKTTTIRIDATDPTGTVAVKPVSLSVTDPNGYPVTWTAADETSGLFDVIRVQERHDVPALQSAWRDLCVRWVIGESASSGDCVARPSMPGRYCYRVFVRDAAGNSMETTGDACIVRV